MRYLKEILEQPKSCINLIENDGDLMRIPKQLQIARVVGGLIYYRNVKVYEKGGIIQNLTFLGIIILGILSLHKN